MKLGCIKMKTVLVVGSQGIIGRHAAEHYARLPDTRVMGMSRRSGDLPGVKSLSADLLKPENLREKLAGVRDSITHIVFAAYIEKPTAPERSVVNLTILQNLLDVFEAAPALEHITFYQGGKAYGTDLGPYKTPAREDDPRLMPPNFYYDQEDLLRQRQAGKPWRFTALRPDGVGGYAVGNPMNIGMVIAVYAVISKELGLPLRFPGSAQAYNALFQMTSAHILAQATIWAGSAPAARNEIFNITNGDTFRWRHLWPKIARTFQMEVADPLPMPLVTYMADKAPLWSEIIRKYDLMPIPYDQLVAWAFGDAVFGLAYDNVFNTLKARQAGFHECIDSEEMFAVFFNELREKRVIPQLGAD